MRKKLLIAIVFLMLISIAIFMVSQRNTETGDGFQQQFQVFRSQYDKAKSEGYNVSEAERLGKEAKRLFDKKDYAGARKLLDESLEALRMSGATQEPSLPTNSPDTGEDKITPGVCVQLITSATSSSGECKNFSTPCDVPVGWTVVDNCPPNVSSSESWYYDGAVYVANMKHYEPNSTFKELKKKIPEIKELGVKTLYLLPIWESDPTYIYNIRDYSKINSKYGTEADLKDLVNTIHANGMKIIFDYVTGYVDSRSVIYNSHPDWLLSGSAGNIVKTWPHNFGYATDRSNQNFINYFSKDVAKKYMTEYGIDGWRVDAPANLWNPEQISGDHNSLALLRKTKEAILSVKSDAILFTEHWGTKQDWGKYSNDIPDLDEVSEFSGGHLFRRWMLEAVTRKSKTSADLENFFKTEKISYGKTRMRFLEDHNTDRIMAVFSSQGISKEAAKPMATMIFTVPGIPLIEAGQEIGETKGRVQGNPFPPVDWSNADYALRDFYIKISGIRNSHPALKYGGNNSILNVWKSGDNIYAYSRTYENETVVVAINFQGKTTTSVLNLPYKAGTVLKDELSGENFTVSDPANLKISVPAYGSRILVVNK